MGQDIGGQGDMGGHDGQHARVDRRAVKGTVGGVPIVQRQGVDRGDKVLVAVVVAFAGPVLDRCGDAIGLQARDMGQGVGADAGGVGPQAARRHDG